MTDINVLPVNDLKEHEESAYCHCNPRIEVVGASLLIVHNSYDKRELKETVTECHEMKEVNDEPVV